MIRKGFFLAALVFAISAYSRAAVPEMVNYQGYLKQGGAVVNGTKSMTFNLYDASTGGAQLCSSGAQSIAVTNGLFSYKVGSSGCDLKTVNWDNAVYLEITVDGVTMSPREQLAGMSYLLQTKAVDVVFAPAGNVAAMTAQAAIEELDNEKLAKTGGTLTGALAVQSTISASGTVTASGFTTTGNATATYFIGDGRYLTSISGTAVDHSTLANLTTGDPHTQYTKKSGDTMTGALYANSGIITAGSITASTGTVSASTATVTGTVTAGGFTTSGNVTAAYLFGDGTNITNISGTAVNHNTLNNLTVGDPHTQYVLAAGDTFTGQIASTYNSGSPFSITSTTVNTNLNADLLDGKHYSDATTDFVDATGDTMSGPLTVQSNIVTAGNITAATGTITAGAFSGDGSGLSNISAGSISHNSLSGLTTGDPHTQYAKKAGDTFTGQIATTYNTGSPFSITSTTVNTNLNADLLDGKHYSDATTDFVDATGDTMSGPLNINYNTATASFYVGNASTGKAVYGQNTGTAGSAGYFENTNSANTGSTLYASSGAATSTIFVVNTNATGKGISSTSSGTGVSIYGTNSSNGTGVLGYNFSGGYGVYGQNDGSGSGIYGYSAGSGYAVGAAHQGTGALFGGNHIGASGNLMQLKSGGVDKFVVSKAGEISAASATFTNNVYTTGGFYGDGSGLSNINAGSISHNSLSGLTTGDPHTQYVLAAGDAMTGALGLTQSAATATVYAYQTGAANEAGYFETTNTANTGAALIGKTNGAAGGYGVEGLAASPGIAVFAYNTGTGYGLYARNGSATTGTAGRFWNSSAANTSSALIAQHAGTASTSYAVEALSNGTGVGVYGSNNGAGSALYAVNSGTGNLIAGNHTGTGNLMQLQKSGVDKFVVDNTGNVAAGSITGTVLNVISSGNTGTELRSTVGGTPYIDFSNDAVSDYDARIILINDTLLSVASADLYINGGNLSVSGVVSSGCPAGFTSVSGNICITTAAQGVATWYNSASGCRALDARLCLFSEMFNACVAGGIGFAANTDYWVNDIAAGTDRPVTFFDTNATCGVVPSANDWSFAQSNNYYCCRVK